MQAINYFVAQKYVEAVTKLAAAPNQKVLLMPLDTSGLIGTLAGVAELTREVLSKAGDTLVNGWLLEPVYWNWWLLGVVLMIIEAIAPASSFYGWGVAALLVG